MLRLFEIDTPVPLALCLMGAWTPRGDASPWRTLLASALEWIRRRRDRTAAAARQIAVSSGMTPKPTEPPPTGKHSETLAARLIVLIAALQESRDTYRDAARVVWDPDLAWWLFGSARHREYQAGELRALVLQSTGRLLTTSTTRSKGLTSNAEKTDTRRLLEGCAPCDDDVSHLYERVLAGSMPVSVRIVLGRQRAQLIQGRDKARSLQIRSAGIVVERRGPAGIGDW